MNTKYTEAIAHLTEHPEETFLTWVDPSSYRAGCLFQFLTPSGLKEMRPDKKDCGCPTLIKSLGEFAWTDELTAAVRADPRIPDSGSEITVASLIAFAEIQELADRLLGRTEEGNG